MAANNLDDSLDTIFEVRADLLKCPVCLLIYKEPKSLTCLHTFCEQCIHLDVMKMKANGTLKNGIKCPLCRKVTTVEKKNTQPEEWTKQLPANYALVGVIESVIGHERESGNNASDQRADQRELLLSMSKVDHCDTHSKQIEFFCVDEKKLCCSSCAISSHRSCKDVVEIDKVATQEEIQITETVKSKLVEIKGKLTTTAGLFVENEIGMDVQIQLIKNTIKNIKGQLHSVADQFENTILNEAIAIQKQNLPVMHKSRVQSKSLIAALEGSLRTHEAIVQHGSASHKFIAMHKLDEQYSSYAKMTEELLSKLMSVEINLELGDCIKQMLEPTVKMGSLTVKRSKQVPFEQIASGENVPRCDNIIHEQRISEEERYKVAQQFTLKEKHEASYRSGAAAGGYDLRGRYSANPAGVSKSWTSAKSLCTLERYGANVSKRNINADYTRKANVRHGKTQSVLGDKTRGGVMTYTSKREEGSGVRVTNISKNVTEKTLKIHFSSLENNGGRIRKIYFPLFNNDAVIFFENLREIDGLIEKEHRFAIQVGVQRLPENVIFTSMEAKLDQNASVLVQATTSLRDEMQFGEGIRISEEGDQQTCTLHGNWFQLEWAWHYLELFMKQQELIQRKIAQLPLQDGAMPAVTDGSRVGVRITNIPKNVTETQLKTYFSKPKNNGGEIKQIYFPLVNNDAVILFEKLRGIDDLIWNKHRFATQVVGIKRLPEHMIDRNASVLVQATKSLRNEMKFGEGIRISEEADQQTCTLHGNWFQLEWACHYLDCFMKQQIHESKSKKTTSCFTFGFWYTDPTYLKRVKEELAMKGITNEI